jgi:hypothetical protein
MSDTVSAELGGLPDVSDAWKAKFELLQKIGCDQLFLYEAMRSAAFKALGAGDKFKVKFNLWGFVLGPIYYFAMKMWAKGAVLLAASWALAAVLTLLESIIGFNLPAVCYWVPSAVVCGQLGNYDYFRKTVHGETMWKGMPQVLSTPAGAIAAPALAFLLLMGVAMGSPATRGQMLEDVSGVWRGDSDGAMVTITLARNAKAVQINGRQIPVTIRSVDRQNHVVTLGVRLANGQETSWALQQLFSDDGRFTLQMTLHDGTQDTLSFVRNL